MDYYNKILYYDHNIDINPILNSIPKRSNFVDKHINKTYVEDNLNNNKPLYFIVNSLSELNVYGSSYAWGYYLVLFGALPCGTKTAVVISDIRPYFTVQLSTEINRALVSEILETANIKHNIESINKIPLKLYNENPIEHLKISFDCLYHRKQALQALHKNNITTTDDLTDSSRGYYAAVAYEYKFNLCGWNTIVNYRRETASNTININKVPYIFRVSINDIAPLDETILKTDKVLIKEHVLSCAFDIETHPNFNVGEVPLPERVYASKDDIDGYNGRVADMAKQADNDYCIQPIEYNGRNESDVIFMLSMVFRWTYDKSTLYEICLTTQPTPPRKDTMIIYCNNQYSIIQLFGIIIGHICPDYIIEFNGGVYDWNFVLERAERLHHPKCVDAGCKLVDYENKYSDSVVSQAKRGTFCKDTLITHLKSTMNCLYLNKNTQYSTGGRMLNPIKLEADTVIDNTHFNVPGIICVDVCVVYRKLCPTSEKWGLNYFLSQNKLGSKEDMPYKHMVNVFEVCRYMRRKFSTPIYAKLIKQLNKLKQTNESIKIGINKVYTIDECLSLMQDSTQVVKYCNVDAERCHDLMLVRNVYNDKREMGNTSYTSLYDGYFRAGGHKVRNMVSAYACNNIWGSNKLCISVPHTKTKFKKGGEKYPGAYVVPPVKGLHNSDIVMKQKRRDNDGICNKETNTTTDTNNAVSSKLHSKYIIDPNTDINTNIDNNANKTTTIDDMSIYGHNLINTVDDINTCRVGESTTTTECNDNNLLPDLPCVGMDFSSLYPSLIMTYNLSPEKCIKDKEYMESLKDKIDPATNEKYKFIEVDFYYGLPDQENSKKQHIRGWFVQHKPLHDDPINPKKITGFAGMGIYPTILKNLFDARTYVKREMEHYAAPKEMADKLIPILNNAYLVGEINKGYHANSDKTTNEPYNTFDIITEDEKIKMEATGVNTITKLNPIDTYQIDEMRPIIFKLLHKERKKRLTIYETEKKDFYKRQVDEIDIIITFYNQQLTESYGFTKLYNEMAFQIIYYNTKQLAIKVFMNTFYGETGNCLSSFFIVEVAGGVTTWGRKNIKLVKSFVEEQHKCITKYGDTDSLYLTPPYAIFDNINNTYFKGEITKKEHWTQMIEITMEFMNNMVGLIGSMLHNDNHTYFLKMAYEEVLFPYAMIGKKKYFGVQHQNIVNLDICDSNCTLDKFIKSKSLFIKGLELKKRGSSQFLKIICYEILKEALCIDNERTLLEIVENKLKELPTRKWSNDVFIRTARRKPINKNKVYKNADPSKQGNVTVNRFSERMRIIEQEHPELNVKVPELNERYNYIIAIRDDITYDERGKKEKTYVGNKVEYFDVINHPEYNALYGPIHIDIDFYIMNEVIGQLARFVVYHPKYDKFRDPRMLSEDIDADTLDELYKSADEKARNDAKKVLQQYYQANYARPVKSDGGFAKSHFDKVNKELYKKLSKPAKTIYKICESIGYDKKVQSDHFYKCNMRGKLLDKIEKNAIKLAQHNKLWLINGYTKLGQKIDYEYLRIAFGTNLIKPGYLLKSYLQFCREQESIYIKKLDMTLDEMVTANKQVVARITQQVLHNRENNIIDNNIEINQAEITIAEQIDDIRRTLIGIRKMRIEFESIPEAIKHALNTQNTSDNTNANTSAPAIMPPTMNKKEEMKDFQEFMQNNIKPKQATDSLPDEFFDMGNITVKTSTFGNFRKQFGI